MANTKLGRPSTYTDALATEICGYIATTGSLRAFCRLPEAPAMATVMRWLQQHEEFWHQYARARRAGRVPGQ
jgi:hypothetical protein